MSLARIRRLIAALCLLSPITVSLASEAQAAPPDDERGQPQLVPPKLVESVTLLYLNKVSKAF